ncbi:hypothetical protein PG996_014410 [Apiospora saccharicola]|uniref:2EXR domain-containing protein n=1 Tax=Apiospora saccharicola TaxID=335842 RepID=A0ABR1TI85_9PEZI
MSASNFTKFPELPTEIRLEIWSLCLPGCRVVEVDIPRWDRYFSRTVPAAGRLEPTTLQSNRFPVISRVCRESREVVYKRARFEGGGKRGAGLVRLSHPGCPLGWLPRYRNDGLWMRRGIDMVHLNWHPFYEPCHQQVVEHDLLKAFQWFAQKAQDCPWPIGLSIT